LTSLLPGKVNFLELDVGMVDIIIKLFFHQHLELVGNNKLECSSLMIISDLVSNLLAGKEPTQVVDLITKLIFVLAFGAR
jgi:hypothetical protein